MKCDIVFLFVFFQLEALFTNLLKSRNDFRPNGRQNGPLQRPKIRNLNLTCVGM